MNMCLGLCCLFVYQKLCRQLKPQEQNCMEKQIGWCRHAYCVAFQAEWVLCALQGALISCI